MLEQQLVDYIKKAKASGQSDEQTRALLYKNGWAEAEVSEAYAFLNQPQPAKSPVGQLGGQATKPEPASANASASVKTTAGQVGEARQSQEKPQTQISGRPEVRVEPSQTNMPSMRKSHTAIKILMVLVILVVLLGAGYFIAGQYLNLSWNPFTPSPKTVVAKMIESMKNVKSSQTKTDVKFTVTDNNNAPQGGFSFSISGGSDFADANNPKSSFVLAVDGSILGGPANSPYAVSADIVGLGSVFYFKINSAPTSSGSIHTGVDISQIIGKWFKFDQDSLTALMEAGGSELPLSTLNASQLNNSESLQKIRALLSADMFSDYKQLASETIDNQNTHHYLLKISKEKLKEFLNKLVESFSQQTAGQSRNSELLDAAQMFQAVVNIFPEAIGDIDIEMWIGKKDYMLYQAKIVKNIDFSKVFPGANQQLEINFSMANSEFNKPLTVVEPQGAQKIEDILLPIARVQKINANMNQISAVAQTVFSTNNTYAPLCRSGLLSGWLKMGLQGISNDIVSQGGKIPVCFAGPLGYCVSTQLADGSYLCIDEQSVLGKTRCISSATVCK